MRRCIAIPQAVSPREPRACLRAAAGTPWCGMKDHRLIDERSLAFDRLIAARLRSEPALVEKARANLARWLETSSRRVSPDLTEWQRALSGPFDELLALLEATDERAARLRQSSPFCGILTTEERTGIIREFQKRESLAA